MAALDNGIITSSLTTLNRSFDVSATWGAWTITIYTLGLSISVPIIGKLSDRFGRRRLFLAEIALFGIGSLLVALSPSFIAFLAARFVQAMGGGGIFIIASSYVLNTVRPERQGRALGMLGGMNGIAAVLGPNIGSFILDITGSWHWLFLINVPIAILLFILGWKHVHETQKLEEAKIDFGGIVVMSAAILLLMLAFTNLDGADLASSLLSVPFLAQAAGAIILLALLVWVEKRVIRRSNEPILPIGLLGRSAFRLTLLLSFFSGAILASVIFIPGYVEQFLNVSSAHAGYWFTPLALASGIGAGGGGALVDKKGPIFTMVTACVLGIAGFLLFPLWVETGWQMIAASCLVGLGFGIMLGAPINVLVTENAKDNKGIALATSSLFRQMGMTLAPTIYAGFLARSFAGMGETLTVNLAEADIAVPATAMEQSGKLTNAASLQDALQYIPDASVKEMIMNTLHKAVSSGYNGLFLSSMAVCCATLLSVIWLGAVRRKERERTAAAAGRSVG